ncbi:15770_t:CDS:2, partial [Acaulospora colombiana]
PVIRVGIRSCPEYDSDYCLIRNSCAADTSTGKVPLRFMRKNVHQSAASPHLPTQPHWRQAVRFPKSYASKAHLKRHCTPIEGKARLSSRALLDTNVRSRSLRNVSLRQFALDAGLLQEAGSF